MVLFLYLFHILLHIYVFSRIFVALRRQIVNKMPYLDSQHLFCFRIDFENNDHFFSAILFQIDTSDSEFWQF
jgi:hypothetical protein